jgi:hypothetical protein
MPELKVISQRPHGPTAAVLLGGEEIAYQATDQLAGSGAPLMSSSFQF